ncbi:MAG: hypothetical protein KJ852_17795 [Gammaproteobacteria bacterium]|nr:hypothetical protein [Gammaproteobacteria bacterium]MBU0785516.1 hypothetical protein [Gammaproteobacteria bacterium]MBU0813716.1 hypothetical protein [Gammaproteobacteria bacterium]MBU1788812.1 hypothetical protein [Gammaproteobacteria bacterium]
MELEDFIDQALSQILAGIRKAQAREGGAYIAPDGDGGHDYASHPRLSSSARLKSTVVDFDIAVTAEDSTKVGGGGGLKVLGFGAKVEGDITSKESVASRIQFAIPLLLPKPNRPWHLEFGEDRSA